MRYVVKSKIMGRVVEMPSRVLAQERNSLHKYEAGGKIPYRSTSRFEEMDGGPLITEKIELIPNGLISKLLGPIMVNQIKGSHLKSLIRLKEILETDL